MSERPSSSSDLAWVEGGARREDLDGRFASLLGLLAFVLYALTAARSIFTGDSAELAAAAACFGVPHPPGYPLYTLLTSLWTHIFPPAHRDFAANLASGLHGAAAVAALTLFMRRHGASRVAAAGAALLLASGRSFWSQSIAAEVYAFDTLLLLFAGIATHVAARRESGRAWLAAGAIIGLWLGHRFLNVVYLPWLVAIAAAGFGLSIQRLASRLSPRAWGSLALGAAASLIVFLYLPLASRMDPPIDIGDAGSFGRFLTVVRGAPYLRHLDNDSALAFGRIAGWFSGLPRESGVGILLALTGLVTALRRPSPHRFLAMGFVWLIAANLAAIARYNILDIRSYWLPSLVGAAGLAGLGIDAVIRRRRGRALGVVILLLCGALLPVNWRENNLSRYQAASRYADDLLRGAPVGSALLVQGDTQTHVTWYRQKIDRVAPEVLVISLGHTRAWYFDQLRERNSEAFPSYRDGEPLVPYMQQILETLGRDRRIFFAFDPGDFMKLTAGPWWGERTIVPSGILLEARRKDEPFDRQELVSANAEYWRGVQGRPEEVDPGSDFETKAMALEYALAVLRCADFAQRQGRADEAAELYSKLLRWRPDRWDAERVAAYAAIGRSHPPLELERRAEAGLRGTRTTGAAD